MKKSIFIRDVPFAVHKKLKVICAKEQRTLQDLMVKILTEYTDKRAA